MVPIGTAVAPGEATGDSNEPTPPPDEISGAHPAGAGEGPVEADATDVPVEFSMILIK
jgi:hypothetical protein